MTRSGSVDRYSGAANDWKRANRRMSTFHTRVLEPTRRASSRASAAQGDGGGEAAPIGGGSSPTRSGRRQGDAAGDGDSALMESLPRVGRRYGVAKEMDPANV